MPWVRICEAKPATVENAPMVTLLVQSTMWR